MELVFTTSSENEANEIKQRLETSGIPVLITGKYVAGIQLPFLSSNLGVFIYINNQYDDAMRLLDDPAYEVKSAVDVNAFYQAIESREMEEFVYHKTNQLIVVLAVIVFFILLLLIIID